MRPVHVTMPGAFLLAVCGALSGASPTLAAGAAAKPLSQMFPVLDRYLQQPAESRTMFRVRYCAKTAAKEPLAVRYAIGGRETILATDDTGCFAALPDLDDLRANPEAIANAGENDFKIIVALEPSAPLTRVIAMADVRAAIAQADSAARRVAGPLAWAAPHLDSVHFEFGETDAPDVADNPAAPQAFAIFPDGRRTLLPMREGRVMAAPDDPAIAGADRIEFDAPPLAARIGFSTPVRR